MTGIHAVCDMRVPNRPGEAPMIPTGRPPKTRGMSAEGRVIQSTAFLNTPGIELLYSVVFGRHQQQAVGRCDALLQLGRPRRDAAGFFHVAVIERYAADRFDLDRRTGWALLSRRTQQRGVV